MISLVVVIQKDQDGEYKVPGPGALSASAYYTDDKEDAVGTALMMYKGLDIETTVKKVLVHTEGLLN